MLNFSIFNTKCWKIVKFWGIYRNTLCHIPPKKWTFYHFLVGEHDNGQQFEQLKFIEVTLFFIEVFRWKKKKFQSKKPHASFNRRLSVAKNPEGEYDNGKENFLKFYFTGGNMAKGITVFILKSAIIKLWLVNTAFIS